MPLFQPRGRAASRMKLPFSQWPSRVYEKLWTSHSVTYKFDGNIIASLDVRSYERDKGIRKIIEIVTLIDFPESTTSALLD